MSTTIPLTPGHYYHIFNRGINSQILFKEPKNYTYFLKKYASYLDPIADTFAYCLLPNHFHFLIRIKEKRFKNEKEKAKNNPSRLFSHFFNSYAQSFNKAYNRHGNLFERPFKRKEVDSDAYFCRLIYYIHLNPIKHRLSQTYTDYPYSSYVPLLSTGSTNLNREAVREWFGTMEIFVEYHKMEQELFMIRHLLLEE